MPLAVCATPIGNLEDVTLRVLRELAEADVVLCEDTRHTRVLLGAARDPSARLLSYHEHNEAARTAELLPRLEAGERMALVSDAGLPGGQRSGRAADRGALEHGRAGHRAARARPRSRRRSSRAASSASATRSSATCRAARRRSPRSGRSSRAGPGRWSRSSRRSGCREPRLARARSIPDRPVAVCRELTKKFEEVVRGPASEVAERFAAPPKGEITLVLGPGSPREPAEDEAIAAVAELVAAGFTPQGRRRARRPPDRRAAQPALQVVALDDSASSATQRTHTGAAAVLRQRLVAGAEDARRGGPREDDRVSRHGDLERVALGDAEALADLARDHDPSQLDRPGGRRRSCLCGCWRFEPWTDCFAIRRTRNPRPYH